MSTENIKNETPIVVETPTEPQDGKIGTMLHDVRIKKKLTIEDISKELHIKTSYLTAIENSDYNNIPEAPYGIGFIRSYATYLGLNSARLVQMFKEETKPNAHHVLETPGQTNEELSQDTESNNIYIPNKNYIFTGIIMLILVYAAWQFSISKETEDTPIEINTETNNQDYPIQVENYTTENEESENAINEVAQINISEEGYIETEAPTETADKNATVEETTSSESTTPEPQKSSVNSAKTGRVILKVKKETWIEVKDDNKLWISKVLNAGDEYVVPDNGEGKTVSFGNTDGVDVVIDGKIVTIVSNNKKTNIKLDAFLGNH